MSSSEMHSHSLQQIIHLAKQHEMQLDLSIGGQEGNPIRICTGNETPKDLAEKWIRLVEKYEIRSLNFYLDIEFANNNAPEPAREFFFILYQELSHMGRNLTLTVHLDCLDTWPHAYFEEFFRSEKERTFLVAECFDRLILLVDPCFKRREEIEQTILWKKWMECLGEENKSKIELRSDPMFSPKMESSFWLSIPKTFPKK